MTEPSTMPVAQISDDTKIETNWGVISAYQKQINERDSKIADLLVERNALTEAVRARDALLAECLEATRKCKAFVDRVEELTPEINGMLAFCLTHGIEWPADRDWSRERLDASLAIAALVAKIEG